MEQDQNPSQQPESLTFNIDGRVLKKDGALKEYDARVQGIASTEAGILQFLGFIMAAIAGITAAGINAKDPYLFLVPLGLLIIADLYVTEKRWIIWLHAAYIRKYLENELTGIWWETRLSDLRAGTRSPVGGIKRVELWMFIIIGVIELSLFAWFDRQDLAKCYLQVQQFDFCVLPKYVFLLAALVALAAFVVRNFIVLRTGYAEKQLFAALPSKGSDGSAG